MTQKQVFVSAVTDFHTTDKEAIGTFRWVGNKCYRYVLNSTGGTLTANRAYFMGTLNTNGLLSEIFTFGQSSKGTAANLLAGVALAAVPAANYGWIQVYGEVTVGVEGTSAVAATDNLKGTTGQTYLIKDTAAGTAPTVKNTAIALAAQGAGGVVNTNVFLDCL